MKGFRKSSKTRDTRRPVSFQLLLPLVDKLVENCWSCFEVILFCLAFSLPFSRAFTISELEADSLCRVEGSFLLEVQMIGTQQRC